MFLRDNAERILAACGNGLVLDVGGWADPFPRADYVLDCFSYETRSLLYHGVGRLPDTCRYPAPREGERFTAKTWVIHDICSSKPFPFPDRMFDFAVCSHTLEDIRDPIRVCGELMRVARAGYIETPSRLVEQTRDYLGMVGASHHRWLVEVRENRIEFTMKSPQLGSRRDCSVPITYTHRVPAAEKVTFLFWRDSFGMHERFVHDPLEDAADFVRGLRIPASARWREPLGVMKSRLRRVFSPDSPESGADSGLWTWAKLVKAAAPGASIGTLEVG